MLDRKVQHFGCDMLPAGHHQPQPSEGHQPPGKKNSFRCFASSFSLILPNLFFFITVLFTKQGYVCTRLTRQITRNIRRHTDFTVNFVNHYGLIFRRKGQVYQAIFSLHFLHSSVRKLLNVPHRARLPPKKDSKKKKTTHNHSRKKS